MDRLTNKVVLTVGEAVYLKNPESSELGQKIISNAIDLIFENGFEDFTFKKLALRIGTSEASVYRYFENKTQILHYLVIWYWSWQEYRLVLRTTNIASAEERLTIAIECLTEEITEDSTFSQINEVKLHQIVIVESSKAYLNKKVDEDNSKGVFKQYKEVVEFVSAIILELQPDYPYPHMLVSTVIEGAHHQRFFAQHLPRLTDAGKANDPVIDFYTNVVFNTLKA